MMSKIKFLLASTLLFLIAGGLCGCYAVPGQVTGGGWMPSSSNVTGEKAVFGFAGDSCDGQLTGHITYVDKNASGFAGGIMMESTEILDAKLCNGSTSGTFDDPCALCGNALESEGVTVAPPGSSPEMYAVLFDYASTNPNVATPTGTPPEALVCAIANTQSGSTPAEGDVLIGAQPPYGTGTGSILNYGPAQGNIKAHVCSSD